MLVLVSEQLSRVKVSELIKCHGIHTSRRSLLPMALKYALRGHGYNLKKTHCHSQLRSNMFSFRVVSLWNSLPSDVVSAPSVNAFKVRLDKYWAHYTAKIQKTSHGDKE